MSCSNIHKCFEGVSVIIPVYNSDKYIEKCVESIENGTEVAVEIILIDDGSTDSSPRLCDSLSERYTNIKVVHNKHFGAGKARNSGLKIAEGKYVLFVDADDWIKPSMIDVLVSDAEKHDAEAVFCGFTEYYEDGSIIKHSPEMKGAVNHTEAFLSVLSGIGNGYFSAVWNKLFLREVLISNSISFGQYIIGEDELWLCEVLSHLTRIYLEPTALYVWRRHSESLLNTEPSIQVWNAALAAKEKAMRYLPEDPLLQDLMKAKIFNNCFEGVAGLYAVGDINSAKILYNNIKPYLKTFLRNQHFSCLRKIKCIFILIVIRINGDTKVVQKIMTRKSVKRK